MTLVATFPEPLDGHKGTSSTRVLQDFYETDTKRGFIRGGFMHPRAHGGDPIELALRPIHGKRWGKEHKDSMRETWRHYLHSHCTGESLPVESNAVDLDPEVTDCYGLPVARITYTSHENDVRLATYLGERSREIYEAAERPGSSCPSPRPASSTTTRWGAAGWATPPSRRWWTSGAVPTTCPISSSSTPACS